MVMEGHFTLGGEHAMKYTDDDLQNCALETYTILLTDVIIINLIKKRKYKCLLEKQLKLMIKS